MQHHLKKYSYLSYKTFSRYTTILSKKVRAVFRQIDPRSVGPFGVDLLPYPIKWDRFFGYKKIFIEIGSGHGELLQHLAKVNEDAIAIGFEISSEYTRRTEKKIKHMKNAMIYKADAYPLIPMLFSTDTVSRIYILFPDPWHKKRHHKRRPITTTWLNSIWSVLVIGGEILFVTDWDEYYDFVEGQMGEFSSGVGGVKIDKGSYIPEEFGLIETHYYKKWKELGRSFQYIKLKKVS